MGWGNSMRTVLNDRVLLGNRLDPITTTLDFLECSVEDAVETYFSLPGRTPGDERYLAYESQELTGSLESLLRGIEPLTPTGGQRLLFIQTAASWTAVFSNSERDPHILAPLAFMSGQKGVEISAAPYVPYGPEPLARDPEFGSLSLYVHDFKETPKYFRRAIQVLRYSKSWEFSNSGDPYEFEDTAKYDQRFKRDRFTFEMLVSYARHFGLRPFDEDFYLTDRAVLVSRAAPSSEAKVASRHGVARQASSRIPKGRRSNSEPKDAFGIDRSLLLLQNRLWPVTRSLHFVETTPEKARQAYIAHAQQAFEPDGGVSRTRRLLTRVWNRNVHHYHSSRVSGTLEEVLRSLEPLVQLGPPRYLFVPTNSDWTVVFDNDFAGTDTSTMTTITHLAGCRGVRLVAAPHTEGRLSDYDVERKRRSGALMFEVHAAGEWYKTERAINLINETGRWEFYQSGTPLEFEEVDRYSRRRRLDRFNLDLLAKYAEALGIRPFDEDFYRPDEALALEKPEPPWPGTNYYSISEVKNGIPYRWDMH